mmetsp:Transcript_11707/g.45630  ORF Transcript_11707/g.45630 Transcript_11707/m.45630 type:complete len:231 (-) Transcript_11707:514-1206(-)
MLPEHLTHDDAEAHDSSLSRRAQARRCRFGLSTSMLAEDSWVAVACSVGSVAPMSSSSSSSISERRTLPPRESSDAERAALEPRATDEAAPAAAEEAEDEEEEEEEGSGRDADACPLPGVAAAPPGRRAPPERAALDVVRILRREPVPPPVERGVAASLPDSTAMRSAAAASPSSSRRSCTAATQGPAALRSVAKSTDVRAWRGSPSAAALNVESTEARTRGSAIREMMT